MRESHDSHETDVARLLGDHHEEIEMDESFRNRLLQGTGNVVAARTGRRFRRALALAAAVAAAVAALMLWGPPAARLTDLRSRFVPVTQSRPSPMKVIAVHQPVSDAFGRPLQLGDTLPLGSLVRTGEGGRVTLVTRRGSEFTLNANTELALAPEAASVTLGAGQLYCRSRGREIAQISTSAGDIHLLGTVLDAAVDDEESVAVTVAEGQVRLTNDHGEALVDAGRRSILVASLPPQEGMPVNTFAQTAWYDGRGHIVSDFGDIAYLVRREGAQGLATEVWAMNADGSRKHHVKTYLGWARAPGPWLPGQQWLIANAGSVLCARPDFENRRAHSGAGHPVVDDQAWLLNAVTGQDVAFDLPPGADPLYTDLSPDGRRLVFNGSYQSDPDDRESREGGLWVFDMTTGEMTKLLEGWMKTPMSWAPDNRRIVADTSQGYVLRHPLVVVDTDTGEVRDLGVDGAGGVFSPDGRKLAYSGEFQKAGSWAMGVPISGRIMVYDLAASKAKPISPAGEGALQPRWSPSGRSVAYWVQTDERVSTIFVAADDGSAASRIYDCTDGLLGYAWMPSGDALYLATTNGVQIIAADGSGLLADLGGSAEDSLLAPGQEEQTAGALEAIREAIYQYAVGELGRFEGKPRDAQAAFQAAADIFAGLAWEYPLANLSPGQLLIYADKCAQLATTSSREFLAESCQERMNYLRYRLVLYVADKGEFPQDLAAVEQHSLESDWDMNRLSSRDTERVKMLFRCPVAGPFTYHQPIDDAEIGEVLVTCSSHPDNQIVWTESLASRLEHSREMAARQAAEHD